jgi:LysR family transcriptional regulator, transcriptional activator of the cysJI operon
MTDFRLKSLLALARTGGVSRAAEVLHLTQPAVSQHIRALEESYGVALVSRRGKRVELTPAGETLAAFAERIEAIYRSAERDMANVGALVRRYEMGVTLTVAEYLIPDLVGHFRRVSPNIRIRLSVQNTEQTVELLQHNRIVLGLVEGPSPAVDLPSRHLVDDELIAVAAARHPLSAARNDRIGLGELLAADLILREPGSGTRAVFEEYLVRSGVDPRALVPFMEIGSLNAIKSLVQSELGVTVVSRRAVSRELAEGSLVRLDLDGEPIMRDFRFVWSEHSDMGFVEEFTGFCLREIDPA